MGRRQKELWTAYVVAALGLWLAASPALFGYDDRQVIVSDLVCGALLVVLGLRSTDASRTWAPWGACAVGLWLISAPVVLWAPSPAAFVNDTLVGVLTVACAVLIPGVPGARELPGPVTPPGWSYNPSSWVQRAPMIAFALFSFIVSCQLAAYQLGYVDDVWDPFFGDGTVRVLESEVSQAFPVADAGLGAITYMLEALAGFMGGRARWRTLPWMVVLFGIMIVPLGAVSIALVIMQPVLVGFWCGLCLLTALFMLVMIPLAIDEVVATGQFLAAARREGKPFWPTFWRGGTLAGDEAAPEGPSIFAPIGQVVASVARSASLPPWTLVVSTLLGFWLMAAPAVFGATGVAAHSDHLVGPLVAVVAVTAISEPVRAVRFVNVLAGLWLVAASWFLPNTTIGATVNDVAVGVALILLAVPRGAIHNRYGDGTMLIR